jgi:hypothetical protein
VSKHQQQKQLHGCKENEVKLIIITKTKTKSKTCFSVSPKQSYPVCRKTLSK